MPEKRLFPHEAEALGLEVKPNEFQRKKARYFLNKERYKLYLEMKDVSNLSITGTSTLEDKDGKTVVKWVKRNKTEEDRLKAYNVAIKSLKSKIEPTKAVPYISRNHNQDLCNQYTLTDFHLGMMSWAEETGGDWDLKIAEDVLVKFFKEGIDRSPNAESAIFAQIGDFLHWDGLDAVTPASKHVLDADTRFTKLVRVAIRVIRRVVDMLLVKYKNVYIIMAEGNHDPASSVWLREMLSVFYENEPRVKVDTNPDPYYCIVFGKVCLFYHHGHKKSFKGLETAFISKFKKEFGISEYVYGHTGHYHHEKVESNLMLVEQHRTLAAKDAYSSRGGYGSGRDSKVITYHKQYGEVERSIININMIQ